MTNAFSTISGILSFINVCLFSWRYSPFWLYFHSPVAGFSLPFLILIYLLTAIELSPGGSSTVHIYTKTIHRTTQKKQYIEQHSKVS